MHRPVSLSPERTWRSAAIVAAAVAAVELVLLVVAAVTIFAEPFADEVEKTAAQTVAKASAPAAPKPKAGGVKGKTKVMAQLSRSRTSVIVLNGNGRTGAASEAAAVVQALNYLIAGTADAPRMDFRRSIVMYRPGFRGEAERLAKDVRIKRVAPLDGLEIRDLQGAHLALILGRN